MDTEANVQAEAEVEHTIASYQFRINLRAPDDRDAPTIEALEDRISKLLSEDGVTASVRGERLDR